MPHQSGCYRRALAFAADEVIELGKKELVVAMFFGTLFKKYEGNAICMDALFLSVYFKN